MSVQFVSIISRQDKPLYIQSFIKSDGDSFDEQQTNQFLKFNFLSHMALDIITSPSSINLREQQQQFHESQAGIDKQPPIYLLLFIQDSISVYGYETSNGIKFIIGLKYLSSTAELNDLFSQIHKCYLRTICNPFNNVNELTDQENLLNSPTFDSRVENIVSKFNKQ